ncbi:hypothetical protein [Actinoplanes sp. L3-i22]|uniref:hypothetical protein n=1 Tax=Actinoplanes sp. L3-i22 TaxID=2836373 RepID=UPI001C75E28E|nr:hypothetical protein [Actinoplanes sp. L3-i22]BCY06561.1 hypothetical protein L3i22_016490 [Actinoplanes sp. L3-i22]
MSLWLRMRGELAGAWRSFRYDLRGRPADRPDGPDVTSTGLSTFPGAQMEWRTVPPETDARPPRRFVAVTALCLLALTGAIGSYLLVTRGLAAADDRPATTTAAAPAPPGDPATADDPTTAGRPARPADDKIRTGTGPGAARPRPTTTDAPAPEPAKVGISGGGTGRATPHRPPATTPECDCVTPPVPTPTVPATSDSTGPEPGGSTSAGASAGPSASTDPSAGASGEDTVGKRPHGRRHWQKTG